MQSRGNQVDSFDQSRVKKSQNWSIRGMKRVNPISLKERQQFSAAHCSINMYFVINVNACIVHFSHENESLKGSCKAPKAVLYIHPQTHRLIKTWSFRGNQCQGVWRAFSKNENVADFYESVILWGGILWLHLW